MKCPAISTSTCDPLRAPGSEILALEKKFSEKTPFFGPKIVILTQKLNFPSKMPLGICSYICHREPHAKFQPNRKVSFRDRLYLDYWPYV